MIAALKLVVFDLDGTLIDSQIDLANSINATLVHYGHAALDQATIAHYIGDGAATLVRRALAHAHLIADKPDPHDDAFIHAATGWFIEYYKVHKLDFTYVYPGVLESMRAMRERRPELQMAILTNKPVGPSHAIAQHFGLDLFCFRTYGGDSFGSKKPDPEGLLALMAEARVTAAETVMVGDSHVDVETARAAGAWALGCRYGLSPQTLAAAGPDAMVDSAAQWVSALGL